MGKNDNDGGRKLFTAIGSGILGIGIGTVVGSIISDKLHEKKEAELIRDFNRVVKKNNTLVDFIDSHDFYKPQPKSELEQKIMEHQAPKYQPQMVEKESEVIDGTEHRVFVDAKSGLTFRRIG